MAESAEAQQNPAAAAPTPTGPQGAGGRGRGRGRGRGGGGVAIEGIAELDASMGRGVPTPPSGGGGKPIPRKEHKDFRGPAGLFKQGDWTCTVCGNVNWERRATCNKCNNPKPNLASLEEAREGLGGGFNERQDRASVATVEVDEDGYDDFGRKKIKARADKKAKEDAALARLRKSFGGGMLSGTSLAPTGKPTVLGQFDDAVTTYDEFGRPKLAGAGRNKGGDGGGGGDDGNDQRNGSNGMDKNARDRSGESRDRDHRRENSSRSRGGDSDRRRRGSRSRSRSRERSSRDDRDRSRRRRSRSRSWDRRR